MQPATPVFRAWAPEWLIRATLFAAAFPPSMLLVLYAATGTSVAGYYGVEPADVQFSLLVFYVSLVAFFPFDPRLSGYLPVRQYFTVSMGLFVFSVWLNTLVHDWWLFLLLRFVQGLLVSMVSSPCLTLIFSRLETTRARALGYSVFYGSLLASGPLGAMLSWVVLDHYDMPALFHAFLLVQLPGAVLLIGLLHNVRLKRRIPLVQLDWASWVLLGTSLMALAYLATYGQQLYWLESATGWGALGLALGAGLLFVLRQRGLRRPYIDLAVLRYRNFRVGLGLFGLFYLFRGTSGIATGYYASVLRVDATQMVGLQGATLAGIFVGVVLVARFVLVGTSTRRILLVGFSLLLVYHLWMYFLFGPGQDPVVFWLPMFLQGLGTGTLMVPLALFTLSSLPARIGTAGSFAAVTMRFLGFITSIALVNFFQLYWRTGQLARFSQDLQPGAAVLTSRLQASQLALQSRGVAAEAAVRVSTKLLANSLETQAVLRYSMNYYAVTTVAIGVLLVMLVLLPPLHRQYAAFRQRPL